jgi:hypothetical protein
LALQHTLVFVITLLDTLFIVATDCITVDE